MGVFLTYILEFSWGGGGCSWPRSRKFLVRLSQFVRLIYLRYERANSFELLALQGLVHRYLAYQNFYASVKMLNFWCEFFFGNSAGKVNIGNELWKSATKRWLLKAKEKRIWKVTEKIYKWKKPLNFICHQILILKIPLKFVMIF